MIVMFSVMLGTMLPAIANPYPNQQVLNAFKKEFIAAQHVSWDKQDDFDKATFVLAGRRVVAFFSSEGQFEGCIRDIFFDQLPLSVMTTVDKRFGEAQILDVREITNAEGTSYRISLETKNNKYRIRVSSSGGINEIQKLKN